MSTNIVEDGTYARVYVVHVFVETLMSFLLLPALRSSVIHEKLKRCAEGKNGKLTVNFIFLLTVDRRSFKFGFIQFTNERRVKC